MTTRLLLCLLFTSALFGCQEYIEQTLTPAQKKKVEAHILAEAPKPQHPIGAIIEDQLEFIGYDVDKSTVKPGESFKITYYLKALKERMDDNKTFVHFQGKKGDNRAWMNLDHHPVEGLLPLRQLKKGQIVKDVQIVTLSKNFTGGTAHIYWGLFRGNYRLKFKNPGPTVKVDKEGRLIVAQFTVDGPKKPKAPVLPLVEASKIPDGQAITLDGKLDDPAWKAARWTKWWTPPNGKGGRAPKTRARFLWTPTTLYIGVESQDADIWSTFTDRDSNTWEQEVIELFIDANGNSRDYLELQVTPANVIFDAKFARHRSDLAKARAWNMAGLKSAVFVDGTLNKRDDTDRMWSVELAVPIAEVPGAKNPPTHGNVWRVNLFRWDAPKQGRQQAAAFSPPVVGDFHALAKFGRLRFVDPAKIKIPTQLPGGTTPSIQAKKVTLTKEQLEKLKIAPHLKISDKLNKIKELPKK